MWEKFSINVFKGVFLHYTIWAFLKLRDKKVKYEDMYMGHGYLLISYILKLKFNLKLMT